MNRTLKLSIISPVYNAQNIVRELVEKIHVHASEVTSDFEIILVDDGSADKSWEKILDLCESYSNLKAARLSRNFGQHYAISAALNLTSGEKVILMDCDLQDNPKYIPALYEKATEGFDIVYAKRIKREFGFFKNLTSQLFFWVLSKISDFKFNPLIGTYTLIDKKVVEAFKTFKDYRRGYNMVLMWLGFTYSEILVEHNERFEGKSTYTFFDRVKIAADLAFAYSDKPLRISIYLGIFFAACSFMGAIRWVYQYLTSSIIEGWTTIVVLISLVGGLIMIFLGIIGIYLSRIFEQVKNRPLYIIRDRINFDENKPNHQLEESN